MDLYIAAGAFILLVIAAAIPVVYTANSKAKDTRLGLNAWDDIPQ